MLSLFPWLLGNTSMHSLRHLLCLHEVNKNAIFHRGIALSGDKNGNVMPQATEYLRTSADGSQSYLRYLNAPALTFPTNANSPPPRPYIILLLPTYC